MSKAACAKIIINGTLNEVLGQLRDFSPAAGEALAASQGVDHEVTRGLHLESREDASRSAVWLQIPLSDKTLRELSDAGVRYLEKLRKCRAQIDALCMDYATEVIRIVNEEAAEPNKKGEFNS